MKTCRPDRSQAFRAVCATSAIALAGAWAATASAQALGDIRAPEEPLVLRDQGSFFVGGESVEATATQLMSFTDAPAPVAGHVTVNQMYVEYMVPVADNGVPVVMLHGATLSGKSYDTTPDGRMGWYEYFVRQGHPGVRPGSGLACALRRRHRDLQRGPRRGAAPVSALPNFWRFTDELAWTQFRFGPTFGTAFPDGQFPVEAAAEFSRQAIPDFNPVLPTPNPNIAAMAKLAAQLNGAVLLGHSQTGSLPLDAALADPNAVKGGGPGRAGRLPGDPVDRRGDRDAGDQADPGGVRRQPRCADRHDGQLAEPVQRLPGVHRARQCRGRRRGDAASARPRHPREQPHDHAGPEQPPDRRPDPASGSRRTSRRSSSAHLLTPTAREPESLHPIGQCRGGPRGAGEGPLGQPARRPEPGRKGAGPRPPGPSRRMRASGAQSADCTPRPARLIRASAAPPRGARRRGRAAAGSGSRGGSRGRAGTSLEHRHQRAVGDQRRECSSGRQQGRGRRWPRRRSGRRR